ncbi:MAG: hypothetical protein LBQ28_03865 [Prevotellaceae bacterium]|jgi:hypothetical protein|nr:hypothetical protein [Prevotellaceae bacterium]
MKNIIFFTILIFVFAGCSDEYYNEGYVKTINATDITNQSAVLNGNIETVTEGSKANLKIARRGFVFDTNISNLTAIRDPSHGMVYDEIANEGNFSGNVSGLLPNTKYYSKAFVVFAQSNKNGRVVYYEQNGKLIYLYEGNDIDSYYSETQYCDVDVFYGNTIGFITLP